MKEQVVCDEVLATVMSEATNILNSRPLTRNSDDPSDEQPITPNHLLKLRPCPTLLEFLIIQIYTLSAVGDKPNIW